MNHFIEVYEDERGYQARCKCNKYHSRWQEYPGAARQLGRVHISRAMEKERKREGSRKTR